jgi:hypothetical protein
MLSVNSYSVDYITTCRARFESQLAAYRGLVDGSQAPNVTSLERKFCRTLLLALDHCFVNRDRTLAGRDSNPLNEVRVLCESILKNNDEVLADQQVRLVPERTVLGLVPGDRIELTTDDFARLSDAFLDAVERTYCQAA